jgi:hypothetical protein
MTASLSRSAKQRPHHSRSSAHGLVVAFAKEMGGAMRIGPMCGSSNGPARCLMGRCGLAGDEHSSGMCRTHDLFVSDLDLRYLEGSPTQ